MRTTEDAIRSLKRYLALVLGGRVPLAAAKLYANPDTADLSSIPEADVLYDHDTLGLLATVGFASAADAAAAGLVRATTVGATRFWVCPPGTAWDAGTAHTVEVSADPYAWSPGLVRGCVDVTPAEWAQVLAADRWGLVLELVSGSGRPYRCAMLAAAPDGVAAGPASPEAWAAQMDELYVDGPVTPQLQYAPLSAPLTGHLILADADFQALALLGPLTGMGLLTYDITDSFVDPPRYWRIHAADVFVGGSAFDALAAEYAAAATTDVPTAGSFFYHEDPVTHEADPPPDALLIDGGAGVPTPPFQPCGANAFGWLPRTSAFDVTTTEAELPGSSWLHDGTLSRAGVTADALPPADDWDVRFFHDEGEFEYPVCVVKTVGAPTLVSNQNWYELTQAYAVYAYPTPPPSATGTASDAHLVAERVRQLLIDAFAAARVDGARPMRIPLYDYDGTDPATPAFHREQADYMRVVGASVDLQQEPNDPRQTVVVADLRLNWRVPVGDAPGRGIVRSVELTTTET